MENLDKKLTLPKIRGDSPAENTQKPSNNFSPKCLPKPKSSRFLKKSSFWVSLVRGLDYMLGLYCTPTRLKQSVHIPRA